MTQHLCVDGKWRPGPVSECKEHKKEKKLPPVKGIR